MERFVTASLRVRGPARAADGFLAFEDPQVKATDCDPRLAVAVFDVESDGPDGPILSIAVVMGDEERVFVQTEQDIDGRPIERCPDERAVVGAFLDWVARRDPDVLSGWNCIDFDLRHIEARCGALGLDFRLGRGGERARVLAPESPTQPYVARVPGRVVLDGIAVMRTATWSFDSWALEHVSRELLGRGKRIDTHTDPVAEIRRMWREDVRALAEYNVEDCRLVRDILDTAALVGFAVERQRLTGLPMDRQGGAVAAFDHLYLPRLHRHGHVAPDVGTGEGAVTSPGGYVMDSAPGLYRNVLVMDFKSLYPSIIRTFRVDPMGLAFPGDDPVAGFNGATFHRDEHILPGIIETLWAARDAAKRKKNEPLSRAIKILMNSFYGVLGTPGCRFFSPKLASSITRRGHEIITGSRRFIEDRGHPVIYGDTDSLFVHVEGDLDEEAVRARGRDLVAGINAYWRERLRDEHRLESFLEMELERVYVRFLMPTTRGTDRGSKKRYAGLVRARDGKNSLVLKGLEAVRTDWTPLARRFQRELVRRAFADEPFEDWVQKVRDDLLAGRLDDELVYRKRLRRSLDDYVKNVPPHVQAARKLPVVGKEIAYFITVDGPEPVQRLRARLDYDHYLEKQLAPAADVVLTALGTDFARIAGRQMSLF
jgi:DNA polymerase-2